jgi:hypothetical protein
MFRPRDSHDQRVLATDLQVSPEAVVRMIQDPHSNSVALVTPLGAANELKIVCSFTIEHAHSQYPELQLSPSALIFPFAYSVEERFDLEHYMRPHHDDPDGVLTHWARQFMRTDGPTGTRDLLLNMNQFIRDHFGYAPARTGRHADTAADLEPRDRDLPRLRAADDGGDTAPRRRRRFVSGYLYDQALDSGSDAGTVGAGTTHAWLQAYLPGAGWVTFDPTNNLLGGNQLIRVGVARDPSQASPISGNWFGAANAFLGMTATVQVRRVTPGG